MARNVEVKAKVEDPNALRDRVEALSDTPIEVLDQEDVFFDVPRARVKLRTFADGPGELIAYDRRDETGPAVSSYYVLRTENPAGLKSFLSEVFGVRGVVRKRRRLYRIGQTRVHLDDVDGLGTFLEVEVVLDDAQSEEDGARVASEILATLGVPNESRIASAYIDLLERSRT
jgi:predicted adenylyl cyclase CyaB